MNNLRTSMIPALLLLVAAACGQTGTSPETDVVPTQAATAAAVGIAASGAFQQNAIVSLETRSAGPNTIIEQRSTGTISGTMSGPYEDELRVVIHPNGTFNAHFTIRCACEVDGRSGDIEMVASDRGRVTGPTTADFSGTVTIRSASGDLAGLRGVLAIEGSVDLASGLSTYGYEGTLR